MNIRIMTGIHSFTVEVGLGLNNIKWLSLLGALKATFHSYPRTFRSPSIAYRVDGSPLKPRWRIRDCLKTGDTVVLSRMPTSELRSQDPIDSPNPRRWSAACFGRLCYLPELDIEWETLANEGKPIPKSLKGTIEAEPLIRDLYRVSSDHQEIDIPLEPVDRGNGTFRWIARVRAPPGLLRFTFRNEKDDVVTSQSMALIEMEHQVTVAIDMPFQACPISEWADPEYSIQFEADWKQVNIPAGFSSVSHAIKRHVFDSYLDVSVLFALISLFHGTRHIHSDDVAYLLCTDERVASINLTRPGMIQKILETIQTQSQDTLSAEMYLNGLTDALERLRRKDHSTLLKNKDLVDSALLQRAVQEWRGRYEANNFADIPVQRNESFLGWLERVHNTLGTNPFLACAGAS